MKVQHKRQKTIDIFEIDGELNFSTSPAFRDKLKKSLEQPDPSVIVCLKKVSYIDSSGLATFVEALQKIQRHKGRLVLCEPADAVRSVFEIAKLDGVFSFTSTRQEAYEILQSP